VALVEQACKRAGIEVDVVGEFAGTAVDRSSENTI